jgi:hypothetical protein
LQKGMSALRPKADIARLFDHLVGAAARRNPLSAVNVPTSSSMRKTVKRST